MDNSNDRIRTYLIEKYNAYYKHWKDANILCAVYALLGLYISVHSWNGNF